MIKNIIPELVSLEADANSINGFYFSENFDFYPLISTPNPFHYKVILDNSIKIPNKYDFRYGYFTKNNECWYYERRIVGNLSLKFKYDVNSQTFSYNSLYSLFPINIGGIYPVGRLIAGIINLDLFFKGYIVFFGSALRFNNKNICIIAPSFNGKTTFVEKILSEGGQYIAGDILILNFDTNTVYPCPHKENNFGRDSDKSLTKTLTQEKTISQKSFVDILYIFENSTNRTRQASKNIIDYLLTNSLFFLNNPLGKAVISDSKLFDKIFSVIEKIKRNKTKYFIKNMYNFDFSEITK